MSERKLMCRECGIVVAVVSVGGKVRRGTAVFCNKCAPAFRVPESRTPMDVPDFMRKLWR